MKDALKAAKSKHVNVSLASRIYHIPRSTIRNHLSGRDKFAPKDAKRSNSVLTFEEEMAIVEYLKVMARCGLALRKIDVSKAFLVSFQLNFDICKNNLKIIQ